jgi:4-carboxymuconolactone decarboxylase
MPDTPTFGRYTEIPFDRMTPEQQEGYRFLVDGPRGRLPWISQTLLAFVR